MNIFVSSFNPKEAAQVLDDKRVIKMILESTQILSTIMNVNGLNGPYKSTHINHPVVKWVMESSENYWWLFEHYSSLCYEYFIRFHKDHKCSQYSSLLVDGYFEIITNSKQTPFVNCTKFKEIKEITQAYRLALIDKWINDKRPPKWTNSQKPEWFIR